MSIWRQMSRACDAWLESRFPYLTVPKIPFGQYREPKKKVARTEDQKAESRARERSRKSEYNKRKWASLSKEERYKINKEKKERMKRKAENEI